MRDPTPGVRNENTRCPETLSRAGHGVAASGSGVPLSLEDFKQMLEILSLTDAPMAEELHKLGGHLKQVRSLKRG